MRVLHVTDHYRPVLGGIETHVSGLTERQVQRGDDVSVLTSTPATADGRHEEDDGAVQVRRDTLPAAFGVDLSAYDVVHAHVSVVAPFTAPIVARAARSGVPTVVTVHSLWNGLGPLPGLVARLTGLRGAPVVWTAVSDVAARELARRLPAGTDVALVPNAVDVAARPGTPKAQPGRPVQVVSTMRVARRKRPVALMRIFETVSRTVANRPVTLTIIGDGPLRPAVERRAERAGLADQVRVTGRLDPAQVFADLRAADVYVAPAVLESFGLAALEARCAGLPVVGHAATGMTGFVRDGVEGMLCRDDAGMVEALRRLVLDDGLRHRISEHNRTTPSTMTWASALDRVDEVYDVALARRPVVAGQRVRR